MEGNNLSGKIANDRNAWMNMEEQLLKELIKEEPENREKIAEYNRQSAHILYDKAIQLIKEIENGELEDKKISENVKEITLLFKAIENVQREHEKERHWSPQEEQKEKKEKPDYFTKLIERIKAIPESIRKKLVKKVGKNRMIEILTLVTIAQRGMYRDGAIRIEDRTDENQNPERNSQEEKEMINQGTQEKCEGSLGKTPTDAIKETIEEEIRRERREWER